MFFVYILQSEKDNKYYYSYTSNLELRIKTHNQGKVRSTKSRGSLKLVYSKKFSTKKEALQREIANTKIECLRAEIMDLQIGYKL